MKGRCEAVIAQKTKEFLDQIDLLIILLTEPREDYDRLKKRFDFMAKELEKLEHLAEIGKAIEQAFDCSAHGIYFGYIGGSSTENFKDVEELLEWYRSQKATNTSQKEETE